MRAFPFLVSESGQDAQLSVMIWIRVTLTGQNEIAFDAELEQRAADGQVKDGREAARYRGVGFEQLTGSSIYLQDDFLRDFFSRLRDQCSNIIVDSIAVDHLVCLHLFLAARPGRHKLVTHPQANQITPLVVSVSQEFMDPSLDIL